MGCKGMTNMRGDWERGVALDVCAVRKRVYICALAPVHGPSVRSLRSAELGRSFTGCMVCCMVWHVAWVRNGSNVHGMASAWDASSVQRA